MAATINTSVKEALAAYFANLTTNLKRDLKVLLNNINFVSALEWEHCSFSVNDCNKCLTFLVDKVTAIRSSVLPVTHMHNFSISVSSTVLDSFKTHKFERFGRFDQENTINF